MATVNELITALGFELKGDALNKVNKIDDGLKTIANTAKKLSGIFAGLKGAVDYFTGTVMKDSQELINLSKATGFGVESLQKWKYAAEASGISAQSFIGDMEHMRKTLLYTEKDIFNLADQLAGMDLRTASQWAEKIGISDETLVMMRKGSKEIRKLMAEAYVIPEESIRQTAEFNAKFEAVKQNLVTMKNEIFMAVSPVLVDIVKKMQVWLNQNKEFIKQKLGDVIKGITKGFERFVEIMGTVIKKIWKFLEGLGLVTEKTPDVEKIATLVTTALLAMVGTSIISGIASLAVGISSIVHGFGALASLLGSGSIVASLKVIGSAAITALAPILTIIETIKAAKEFADKGVAETVEDWKENFGGWDWINPVKLTAIGAGWAGEKIADWINPVQDPSTMKLPTSNVSSMTTTDSHNTLYMYMTSPQDAQNALADKYGLFPKTSMPVGYSPLLQP